MLQKLAGMFRYSSWALVILAGALMFLGAWAGPATGQDGADAAEEGERVAVSPPPPANYIPGDAAATEQMSEMARKRATAKDDWGGRAMSLLGIFGFIFIAWVFSSNRKAINWRTVAVGVGLQLVFALLILWLPPGKALFAGLNDAVIVLLGFTQAGSDFLFQSFVTGEVSPAMINIAFNILPTIIFFSSLMTVLYHLGVMQWLVKAFAALMVKFMGTSGSETLSASANIFVGQTEAPLVVKPYVKSMTRSELMAIMTGGFATVAGGVLAAYVGILSPFFPDIAGHLIAASVMSAPAALVIAKIMIPETDRSMTMGSVELHDERPDTNAIDAAARGAGDGLKLALNVGAMLLAFIALIAMMNYLIGLPSRMHNEDAVDNVQHWLTSAMAPTTPGCDDPKDNAAVIECAHSGLIGVAAARNIEVPEELQQLDGEEDARIATVEELGVHVRSELEQPHPLAGSRALADCNTGRVAACGAVLSVTQSETWTTSIDTVDLWPFITLEVILGWLFLPLALLMGVPLADAHLVGQLLGEKMVLNELIAYLHLAKIIPELSYRSIIICTYALCGFANFGSIAIQIGGIGGIAPSRRSDLAALGIRSMIAGTLAAFMTATIAGALVQ